MIGGKMPAAAIWWSTDTHTDKQLTSFRHSTLNMPKGLNFNLFILEPFVSMTTTAAISLDAIQNHQKKKKMFH